MTSQNSIEVPARRGKTSAQFSIHEGSSGDEHENTGKAAHGVMVSAPITSYHNSGRPCRRSDERGEMPC